MGGRSLLQGVLGFLLISVNRGQGRETEGWSGKTFSFLFTCSYFLAVSTSAPVLRPLLTTGPSLFHALEPASPRLQAAVSRPPRVHILMVRPLPSPPASEVGAASRSLSSCWHQHAPFASSPLRLCLPSRFSHVLWTAAQQAPPSVRLSRQEHCSGLPCPPPGGLPHPGMEPASPVSFLGRQALYHRHHLGRPFSPREPREDSCFY